MIEFSRRRLLQTGACGFGALALNAMLSQESLAANPLAARATEARARAKRVIFLFMKGGPSQVDMFDYKPRLAKENGNKLPFALPSTEETVGLNQTKLLGPVSEFEHRGASGLFMTKLWPHMARHADELCVLRAMKSDSPNHPVAIRFLHTGTLDQTWPSMGAWVSYGLGTQNSQLPSYITILPAEGEPNYSSAFLPAVHQGTAIQNVNGGTPIRHLTNPKLPRKLQRRTINLLQSFNKRQLERLKTDRALEGVVESFELAFKMQLETPKIVDLSRESKGTLDLYGVNQSPTDRFARQCLLARRFSEAGVRFVQVSMDGWDHHGQIRSGLPKQCAISDKPIAGLLSDLKARGLLDETLVVWAGEFGRTPFHQDLNGAGGNSVGREHNPRGFTIWMAGGGVRPGITYGTTDEYGYRGVDGVVHIHDLHATILHLLGLDHEHVTFNHGGRDFRLTDVHGDVVRDILA